MKDLSKDWFEDLRPSVTPLVAINHALDALYADGKKSTYDKVVKGLSFEELLGALKFAKELAKDAQERLEREEREG